MNEVIFVRGATEAINLVAKSWGKRHIAKDDEIVIGWIEHHANIVPWQMLAAETGARVLVDGAQSVSHMSTDVQALDCDFLVFSGHKVFGPTGIGVLHGKPDVLADSPPWQGGGKMIVDVMFEKTIYHAPPARFEVGTGNIADAVGLGAAVDYVESLGMRISLAMNSTC